MNALDNGLDLDAWARFDPTGFEAAARNVIDGDDLMDVALDMIQHPARPVICPMRWREAMEKALAAEYSRGATWINDWASRFAKEDAA